MLAFLGPTQIMVLMIILLIVFGPQKLPEIGQQLGRALRELRRSTQEFTNAIHLDDDRDRYNNTYDPPDYNNYNSPYSVSSSYTPPEDTDGTSSTPARIAASEPPRGDFAAAAFADTNADYEAGAAGSGSASTTK